MVVGGELDGTRKDALVGDGGDRDSTLDGGSFDRDHDLW